MQTLQLSCAWISKPPPWLDVASLKLPVDSALAHLDAGEREAISLASELQATLLLMDERDGVTIARHRGLKVVGTLAALDIGAVHGLVELQTMFERLCGQVPVAVSPHGEHARAGCRTQESSGRPTVARGGEKPNLGTIRGQ